MLRLKRFCSSSFRGLSTTGALRQELPTETECVVVGAGAVGSSTAYHLAKRGVRTVLVERHK